MCNKIAEFNKVSFEQFKNDWKDSFNKTEIPYCNKDILDIYNHIKKPVRATSCSAGYDIFAPIDITLLPGQTIKIPTGLRCSISDGWYMAVFPRSGQGFKYGIRIANTVGIIDGDYVFSDNEGHIFIKLINDSSIRKTFKIDSGEAFAQAIFMQYGITVNDCADKKRNGGFGSTSCCK